MTPNETELLLEEYRANIALWQHDDNLRQVRTGNFLTFTAVLISGLGVVASVGPLAIVLIGAAFVVSLMGLSTSLTWRTVQARNAEYVRLRRLLLVSLETRLPPMSSVRLMTRALNGHEVVELPGLDQTFQVRDLARSSSTVAEARPPLAVICLWSLVLVAALVATVWILVADVELFLRPLE